MERKFNNAFILSGGGTRLMIYLGMYAALEELQMKPDVLIATCGGAFAATVITTFPDTISRKAYLKSEEYYQFVTKDRLTKEKKLSRIGLLSLQKVWSKKNAPLMEDVFHKYLADVSQDFSRDFPSLTATIFSSKTPTLLIGSQILFDPKLIGQKRDSKKLYQKVIFTDEETASKIDLSAITITSENYRNSAVSASVEIKTNLSMLVSARISVSDMYYVAPVYLEDTYFAGGAIDLIPIELAKHLANTVTIEKKQSYSPVEEALVRAVLGYSGNQRLQEIENQGANFQIDTVHIKKDLEGHYIKKSIDWKNVEICFEYPKSYQDFKDDMDKQWEYGYRQTMKTMQSEK
ncbi:patatin-like phospholipase family protein [Cellulophaga sp. HaHa_2_1]|uniref:patatin-like phospholipase family protein n=1 Tax=Cellulophaga sp. HaHa_2_1 TaxID=2749994 RepID=UPI001C4F67F8|nr:patatin-like phospholipase family protein [Cellulophaga sp. HaHa_2_1]QXP53030.1 patatin-like phospholipase family protein [Cellulophaga sp. HaHa_2_1]